MKKLFQKIAQSFYKFKVIEVRDAETLEKQTGIYHFLFGLLVKTSFK